MESDTKNELKALIKTAILFAPVWGIAYLVFSGGDESTVAKAEPVVAAQPSCGDHMHVAYMIVTDTLTQTANNPAAVQFSKLTSPDTQSAWSKNNPEKNECEMWISGWMEGTNGFGATLRKPWVATFTYDIPTDNLVAKDFKM